MNTVQTYDSFSFFCHYKKHQMHYYFKRQRRILNDYLSFKKGANSNSSLKINNLYILALLPLVTDPTLWNVCTSLESTIM